MKTKLTSVMYLGYTVMDRRFSNAMLPWILREIRSSGVEDKLSIAIEEGCLKAYNGNFEPVIVHRLLDIIRASQVPGRPEELFYLLFNEKEASLHCYLFRAGSANEVTELFSQMREPSPGTGPGRRGSSGSVQSASVTKNIGFQQNNSADHLPWSGPAALQQNCNSNLQGESPLVRSSSNASALTSLCTDLSPSDSHFFEVLYIGKVRISQRKVPESLIDDALVKFAHHEAEKAKLPRRHSLLSSAGTSLCSDSTDNVTDDKNNQIKASNENISHKILNTSTTPLEPDKSKSWKSVDDLKQIGVKETAIEDEFDMFTKERVEKNGQGKKNNGESVGKGVVGSKNLGTVEEDEEKNEEIHSIISQTASSITLFCRQASKDDNDDQTAEKFDAFKKSDEEIINSPTLDENSNKPTETIEKLILNTPKPKDLILNLASETNTNNNNKLRDDSPAPAMSFDEIPKRPKSLMRTRSNFDSNCNAPMPENKSFLRDRSASIGTLNLKTPIAHFIGEQNRTMLFQVGRTELRLISPDRKQILLHRAFKDVASCVLGRTNKEHFGFVCRETNDTYACYVFKCESDSIATEVVNAIKQAFVAHADLVKKSREKSPNMTCEHCPMLWYHRLCQDIEGMNEKRSHAFILRRIEQLPDEEQELLITKYQGGTNHMYEINDHIAFLMMLLRAHCESKQQRHVHDTAENRSEFLNQYLGSSTIFMKAKRSLSSGFDHLLKRRQSKDDVIPPFTVKKDASPLPIPRLIETSSDNSGSDLLVRETRSKSVSPIPPTAQVIVSEPPSPRTPNVPSTPSEENGDEVKEMTPVKSSPMMDIFLKVSDSRPPPSEAGAESEATWRQALYEKVLQPPDNQDDLMSQEHTKAHKGKRTREQLRQLWKMAIDQTILLVRMERENTKLKENEESSAVRRIKLEYTELGACETGVPLMWDSLLKDRDPSRPVAKVDRHMLTQAVIQGVPRVSRGSVWYFLAEQAALRLPPPDTKAFPNYHTPYRTLLQGLTKHQHSILIDLGRTFPQHEYFASALGPGQLSLYNLLKAYSLLDPDVGYCQGLSFVAGVLLLHMEEAEAFILLRHLMFRRGLRKQYLPDMSALQVQLYQLSRLVRDHEPELQARLEALDVSPALYAAPWMLTLFTSQFPLGFVVRVFDLIFLESLDVVFSVSLALLSVHKDGLLLCESCEEAAEYLKHKLPDTSKGTYEKVMKKILSLDISRQLSEYAVEYSVLREEMPRVASLSEENKRLHRQHKEMTSQLDSAMDAITNYQTQQSRIESQNKTMEQQLTALSRYIQTHRHQDPPPDIKKILQTYNKKISFSTKISSFSSKFTSNDDDSSDNSDPRNKFKTGASAPNLFAKITKEDVVNAVNNNKNRSIENDRKQFLMKKSQSMHLDLVANNQRHYLKVLEEKAENDNKDTKMNVNESVKDVSRKSVGFLANTQEQIRQERLLEHQLKHDFDENLKKLDEKLRPNPFDDVSIFQCRKSMSLNFDASNKAKLGDSGFVTPMSPDVNNETKSECSLISHPLSDCDVEIKFDGQLTKLKQIRPLKNISVIDNKNA